ncbi:MAG TPA: hypothetical protein VMW56_12400 [Candidatus Margulisiibacteriota bacterium]|nr:hypothetical protein [Candidatus Margulisiibacteriota bacterium]
MARARRYTRPRPPQLLKPVATKGAPLAQYPTTTALAFGALLPLLVAYLSCFKRSLIDDAFITLQYASTLRHYGQWGFFPDAVANTATSPLNVILTALVGIVAPNIVDAAIWLASVELLGVAVLLSILSQRLFGNLYFGVLAFVATIANPWLMSSIGLETLLYVALMAGALCLLVLRRWAALAVCLALLTLTRPDGILLFAAVLLLASPGCSATQVAVRTTARPTATAGSRLWGGLRFALIYALGLLPWHLFAWIHLGSLLPDTFFLKVGNPWGSLTFTRGLSLYLWRYPWETPLSFILVPFLPLWVLRRHRDLPQVSLLMRVLAVYAAAYYTGYALLRLGPYHWYYAPVVAAANWMGALALACEYHRTARLSARVTAALLAAPALTALAMAPHFLRAAEFPPTEAPIHTNWATHDRYEEIGMWLREHTAPTARIRTQAEIGTLAFYSQRRLIDAFSCRGELEALLRQYGARAGIVGVLMRLNFFWLDRQPACGPFDERLIGSQHAVDTAALPGVVRSWRTSTKWVADGVVLFMRQ